MATTADSSSNHHSPRGSGFSGDGVSSPQFRRRNFPSAWAQIVRGDHEPIPAANLSSSSSASSPVTSAPPEQASFSDCSPPKEVAAADNSVAEDSSDSNSGNAARHKKPAWNKPSNGVVEVGPVMGADSWPALSESARASPKSVPDSSSKPISDGSVTVYQAPAILHSPQKQATTNANPNSTPNHALPVRQRSRRGVGGTGVGGGHMQSGFHITPPPPPPLQPPPPPPFPVFEMTQNTYGKLVPAPVPDSSPREPAYRGNNWDTRPIGGFVSQPHSVNDHPSPRNSSRRGNYGPHPRGDGQYHNNYGGRRDHDRGNQDWNSRNSNQPHRAPPRNFVRHPPSVSAPFIAPPARPFGNPMAFTDMTSPVYILPALPPESFRGVPFVTHAPPPPVFFPLPDPNLHTLLVNQIDYYFSDANLIKDEFLKSNMDELGWVPIGLIASFPRVKNLTHSIPLILESLRASTIVEVKDDKVRRCNEWMRWIPSSSRVSTDSGLQSPGGSNMLATSFQRVTLEEVATNQNSIMGYTDTHPEAVPGRSSSEELTGQSQHSNGEGTDQATSSNQV